MGARSTPFESLAADTALLERFLSTALSRGGDYADLFFELNASSHLALDEQIIKSAGRSVDLGVGVRVQKGDATGYAYVESLEHSAIEQAARTAAAIASSNAAERVEPMRLKSFPSRYAVESTSLDIAGTNKKALLVRADRAARAYDPRITRVEASFAEQVRDILVATSDGVFARDRQPMVRINVSAVAESGALRQTGRSGGGGRYGLEYFVHAGHKPEDHGREAARIALAMLDAKDAPAGEMPVVLAPGDSGILLHEAIGHGLEADFNRKKTSRYSDRVGQSVASSICSVVDDPTEHHGRGSLNVDDEGVEARPVTLIENGVLCGYMQDRLSARYFKTASGNGRRESFRHSPMPRMTNTILLGGKDDPDDIIKKTKRGVFAKRFSGGQVNIANGDFVFSLTESYLIEDGKLTAPLKGVNLIGNGPDVLTAVDMLGADLEISDGIWTCGKDGQSVPVGVGCPTVRISKMTVGGTRIGGSR
ncbi:MAG: metalloprotease TldD [Deltaproteobacteria bacterium]|nr:metalloprotease TldD [Deltaproteobacteria bacterium]